MHVIGKSIWLRIINEDNGRFILLPAIISDISTPEYGDKHLWATLTLHVYDTRPGHAPIWVARDVHTDTGRNREDRHWTWVDNDSPYMMPDGCELKSTMSKW